jgi:hypothetical protein
MKKLFLCAAALCLSGLPARATSIYGAFGGGQSGGASVTVDSVPVSGSAHAVASGAVYTIQQSVAVSTCANAAAIAAVAVSTGANSSAITTETARAEAAEAALQSQLSSGGGVTETSIITASGTFNGAGAVTFPVSMTDGLDYSFIIVATCTASGGEWGFQFNGDTASDYGYHLNRNGGMDQGYTTHALLGYAGTINLTEGLIIRGEMSLNTSWSRAVRISSRLGDISFNSGGVMEFDDSDWTGTAVPASISIVQTSGGVCTGKYKFTTTNW